MWYVGFSGDVIGGPPEEREKVDVLTRLPMHWIYYLYLMVREYANLYDAVIQAKQGQKQL